MSYYVMMSFDMLYHTVLTRVMMYDGMLCYVVCVGFERLGCCLCESQSCLQLFSRSPLQYRMLVVPNNTYIYIYIYIYYIYIYINK